MNSTPSRPGVNAANGSGDERELLMDLFGGEVLTAFATNVVMRDKHTVKTLAKGKLFKFPAIWRVGTSYHVPGTEITGKNIPHTEVIVQPDDKLISDVFIADIDEILNHFDLRGPYATELGSALARFYDANVIRRVVQSARGGALFAGDQGGSTLSTAGLRTDATKLLDAISAAKQVMDEKDVPVGSMPVNALFKAAQWYLMKNSDKNLNADTNGGSSDIRRSTLTTVDDVNILKSNLAPFGVNDSANAALPAKYRADFTNTVGTVWTPGAVATAEVQGLSTQIVDLPTKQGTLIISRLMVGTDPLRTKEAVELAQSA